MKQSQNGCASQCGAIASERNRYFTGKFMAARDFQDEQDYFLTHHRLHNRLLHGWGIVCGLEVKHHPDKDLDRRPNSECAQRWVIVNAGVALDCCGRELIIPKQTAVELKALPRVNPAARQQPGAGQYRHQQGGALHSDDEEEVIREPFLLVLRYEEEVVEQVPALLADNGCDSSRKQANRVREVAKFDFVRLKDVENCWRSKHGRTHTTQQQQVQQQTQTARQEVDTAQQEPQQQQPAPEQQQHAAQGRCIDDCPDPLPGPSGACLDPICPCGHTVPLALINFDPDDLEKGFEIDSTGRRRLPTPPHLLTHIVDTNWTHGERITLRHLRQAMNGQLVITFDRKLLAGNPGATGINPHTFVVQYGGIQGDLEMLPYDPDHPPHLSEDGCSAVFTINPDYIARNSDNNIAGNMVYITLKCNFILDCHDNPVDGDHLGGMLPTGDGTPGGTFESWFRAIPTQRRHSREEEEEEEAA